jgi:hypothetical protein
VIATAWRAERCPVRGGGRPRWPSRTLPGYFQHLPDGSYLSGLDGLTVRIIEADLTMTGSDGSRVRDSYRLITTLLDHARYPGNRSRHFSCTGACVGLVLSSRLQAATK